MYKLTNAAVGVPMAIAAVLLSVSCNRSSFDSSQPAPQTTVARQAEAAKNAVSDTWITTKIQAQFFADPDVRGRNIDVTTTNGAVMLMGRVDNDQARRRAVELAQHTDGVAKVEDHLTVGPEPSRSTSNQPSQPSSQAANRIASGWITTKIQAQYFADQSIKGRDIDVSTANGVVTLNGTVDSETAHERAVEIARRTDGVRDVEDHLSVQASQTAERPKPSVIGSLTDAEITSRVQSKYFVDDDVKAREINVDTKDGVVTLSGTVDSERAHRQAVNLARRTAGVRDVRDQLRVEAPVATSGRRTSVSNVTEKIEDLWITAKIQSRYFLDPDVRGLKIDVTTENGVVTLTGEADNAAAHRKALEMARETDGVTRVVDHVKVVAPLKPGTPSGSTGK